MSRTNATDSLSILFPADPHHDQVDSTGQALAWKKIRLPGWGVFEYYRDLVAQTKGTAPERLLLRARDRSRPFDEGSPSAPAAGKVEAFPSDRIASWDKTEERRQLSWRIEPADVADLGGEGHRDDK